MLELRLIVISEKENVKEMENDNNGNEPRSNCDANVIWHIGSSVKLCKRPRSFNVTSLGKGFNLNFYKEE
jgi:hypothetical protein